MNIREFLLEKPQENNIISFLQDGASQSENQNTSEYLSNLKNEVINDFYKNKDKYAKEYEKYNFKDQNLTNPMGNISEYKRDLYDYNKNPSMNADDLSNYILDKQSKFNASKPIFADDNEVVRKSNQFMRDLGDELQKSGRGRLLQDDDGSYWVQDNNGNYSKVQGSAMGDLYRGLRDNGASMALGIAGAIGGTMLGGGVGMVAGGALGASLGAGYDYYGNTKDTNQDMNLKEALMLMGENAGLSLIGDAAFAGVAKGVRALKNTYNMAKTGAQAGKDMIDGMAVKGGNLKENIGDKLRKISPSILNDLASQGSETSKAYARELIESGNRNYDDILQKSRAMPLEVNQGNALVDGVASKIKDFSNTAKNGFVKNTADNVTNSLNNISKNIGSKEAALNQQDLINLSFMNDDLANMARSVLANDPKMANKVANSLHLQDEAILKELNLNNASKADELYALRDARAKRAYDEFGKGLDKLDELNPNGVKVDKQTIDDIVLNSSVYSESTPAMIKNFIHEAKSGALDGKSVKEIYDRIDAIGNKIKESSSYNYKDFLNSLKDAFLENIVKSADNPQEAKEILTKIRKDYADFKVYDKSKLGKKLEGSEKEISKDIDKILNETNPKKNYEAITKGLNDDEIKVLDNQIITRALEKNKVNIGDANNPKFAVNYKAVMDNFENFKPKSKSGQEKIEVLKTIGDLRTNFETVIDGILNSKAKELGHGISTNFIERAKTMLVNNFTDYIAFYFMRLWEVGKRAGTRIQMRRGFSNINNLKDFDRSAKEFIESIKDKTLKEEAQEARKEFNSKVKDLIKGDNFFMDKADPKDNSLRFIGKNGKEYTINKDVRNEWMKTFNLKNIDDEYIPNIPKEAKIALKDREIKLTKGSLLKLIEKDRIKYIPHIKETLESPQAILKDKDDFIFIKNIDNQTYFTSIGKDYETHLTIISNSPKKQNNIKNKMKNAEVVYYNNARALPTSRASSETKQVSFSNENSTQAKPKTNLMDDIKKNIKAKEVEKKNKKSVKQSLDEKIQNDKKASEDILKRYDNFLKENKDYNFDFLDNMNLNTVEYNLTRQMIINAKESTNKGVKKDIPSALRGKIEKELNIQPLKEFGENYAEYYHDGKGALQKLLIEKQGQVAGAFHRKDLGDIDLVWGEVTDKIKHKGYGLAHIIDKHPELDLKLISDIVDKGKLNNQNNIRYRIEYKNYIIGLSSEYKGNKRTFIITAFERYKG
ncbi:putative barnase/colicin E5 family endoribonuclease [Campylobacter jejuni]|uniref:putative barnase/colicin E5 family endoribonuclease n=1 Tax=Campylobacter jejuni TaxID=197 RepID=UPI00405545E6